jgi:hypothetical protein
VALVSAAAPVCGQEPVTAPVTGQEPVAAPVTGQEPVMAPVRGQAPVTSPVAIAGGFGVSSGLMGALLARRIGELPLAAVLGLGIEGLVPQLQVDLFTRGNFNLHVGGGVLYNPWGGLVFSPGSVVGLGSAGVQRWAYRWQHGGVFLNADVQLVKQFRGTAETRADHWAPGVGGQIGAAF